MKKRLPSGDMVAIQHYYTLHDPEAAPEDLEHVMRWLESDIANQVKFAEVEQFVSRFEHMRDVLSETEIASALRSSRKPIHSRIPSWAFAMAACLVIAIGLTLGLTYFRHFRPVEAVRYTRYETAIGETRTIRLPDRSEVTLAGASAMSVAYSPENRRIALTDGEALFEVVHDKARPFLVQTSRGSIRAVGTRFDVRHSPIGTTVTVLQGRVNVAAKAQDRTAIVPLAANMQVTYDALGNMSQVMPVDAETMVSWRRGLLRFDGAPLALVVAELNRYSPVPIILSDQSLASKEISGIANVNRIGAWLEGLSATSDISVEKREHAIILSVGASRISRQELSGRRFE